ncbi:hypothetical protein F7725_026619 [Dissostichus mawsoni]|uniref:Uncharacterized protein n=1 Tax=Dissostichus mawsoni TaxID=36200 RepID=A0A7J5X7I6_DISMA|nr:hypothetical protein F7725_026619 [Dissostichus mawsoni]
MVGSNLAWELEGSRFESNMKSGLVLVLHLGTLYWSGCFAMTHRISIPTEYSLLVISHKPAGEKALENLQREKVKTMNTCISSRQHLTAQMELLQSLSKLTPEERKAKVRRQMCVELKVVEMERRPTALETLANSERDREETKK